MALLYMHYKGPEGVVLNKNDAARGKNRDAIPVLRADVVIE